MSHSVQRVQTGLAGMRIGQQQPPRPPPMSSGAVSDAYGRGAGGAYVADHSRNTSYDMWSHGAVASGPSVSGPHTAAAPHYMMASSMPSAIGGHSTSTASHAQSYVAALGVALPATCRALQPSLLQRVCVTARSLATNRCRQPPHPATLHLRPLPVPC